MEVQVFGTRHCNETKKALRFFKERRIKVHFVDLEQRPAAPGELRRFGQKFGWGALLRRPGRSPQQHDSNTAKLSESQVLPRLEADQRLLVTPLVRTGNELAVGWDEARWRVFCKAAS